MLSGCALVVLLLAAGCANKPAAQPALPVGLSEIAVVAPDGAEVEIDGVALGALPLASAVRLRPGQHSIRVSESGHYVSESRIGVRAGFRTTTIITLAPTEQRVASWFLMGGGGVGVLSALVTGVASFAQSNAADGLIDPATGAPTVADREAYAAALDARDDLRLISGAAVGVGLGLFALGAALYAFDPPRAGERPRAAWLPTRPPAAVFRF